MSSMTLGEKVKDARKELNLTQADVVGDFISRTMLSKIENDNAKPSIETIEYLAKRFNKPISYFWDDDPISHNNEYQDKNITEKAFEHASYLIKNKEFERAKEYLFDFIEPKKAMESDFFYARIQYNLGLIFVELANPENALTYFSKAIDLLEKNSDYYYLSKAYFKVAAIHFFNENYIVNEEFLKKSIFYLGKSYVEDILYEITCYYNLGYSFYNQGKYDNALLAFSKSLEKSNEYKCFYEEGRIHMIMGVIYIETNDIVKAIVSTKKAVDFFNYAEKYLLKAASLKNLGNMHIKNNQYEEGIICLKKALKYYESEKDNKYANIIRGDIFKGLICKSSFKEALEYSSEIETESLPSKDLCTFYKNLGKTYLNLKNIEKAKEYLVKVKDNPENQKYTELMNEIYTLTAECYSQEENYKEAYAQIKMIKNLS